MEHTSFNKLKATYINCTLKKSPVPSHTDRLMDFSREILINEGLSIDSIRLADHEVPPGVYPDMREQGWDNDEWPELFKRIMASDILIIGTPIWLGEKSSLAQRLLERLYAMSAQTNEKGQYIYYGKAAGCMITGNEDGIKHCAMGLLYSLQHLGYTIPPQADSGWIGEVGPGPSFGDREWRGQQLDPPAGFDSSFTRRNTTFMSYNLLHLASMLQNQGGFPAYRNTPDAWKE